jgi:hypothetical protein
VTADSDPPLADVAPVCPRRSDHRTLVGRILVAVLLTLGCSAAAGGAVSAEPVNLTESSIPVPADDVAVSLATESARHHLHTARRRLRRAVRVVRATLAPGGRPARPAGWILPVQFRLMPPVWRGPTVLRL